MVAEAFPAQNPTAPPIVDLARPSVSASTRARARKREASGGFGLISLSVSFSVVFCPAGRPVGRSMLSVYTV